MTTPLEEAAFIVLLAAAGYVAIRVIGRLLAWWDMLTKDQHHD